MASKRSTLKAAPRADFGSRTSRRMRREGLVPGRRLLGRLGGASPSRSPNATCATILSEGAALFDLEIEGGKAVPVVVKEQQLHPVRGSLQHIDLQQVKLDEAIQAEVAIELEGVEVAPGVKGGGVLEHVTREITVEALPTEIPDNIVVDVSAMEINDTLQLSDRHSARRRQLRRRRPRGGHDRHPLAAARRRGRRARGRGGDRAGRRGRGGRGGRGRGRRLGRVRGRVAPVAVPPPRAAASRATASSSSASATPGPSTSAPATTSASTVASELARRWDLPKPQQKFNGGHLRRADRPGRAAGGAAAAAAPT